MCNSTLINCRIGKLVVLKKVFKKKNQFKYLCKCDCGKQVRLWGTALYRLKNNRPKLASCGCETLSRAKRVPHKGTFVTQKRGVRKLGPGLRCILKDNKFEHNNIAQISRAITFRLKKQNITYNPESLLGDAFTKLSTFSNRQIKEQINKLGYREFLTRLSKLRSKA